MIFRKFLFLVLFGIFIIPNPSYSQLFKKNKTMSPKKREKQLKKTEQKKEREKKKAIKAAHKSHLDIQDKKVRRRLKKNRRKSNRKKK